MMSVLVEHNLPSTNTQFSIVWTKEVPSIVGHPTAISFVPVNPPQDDVDIEDSDEEVLDELLEEEVLDELLEDVLDGLEEDVDELDDWSSQQLPPAAMISY